MNLFKCLCLGIVAIVLCGCGESRAEFNALNLGKVNVIYENGALKIESKDSPSLAEGARGWVDSTNNAPFILFFFTTTCGVCKAQIPILQEITSESASSGARIYAILGNVPNEQKAKEYLSANAMLLPLFYESEAKRFFSQIVGGVKGVPVVVIFDKNGRMKERFIGLIPKGVIKGAL